MASQRKQAKKKRSTRSIGSAKQVSKKPKSAASRSRLPVFAANLRSANSAVRSVFTASVSVPQFLRSVTPLTRKQRLLLIDMRVAIRRTLRQGAMMASLSYRNPYPMVRLR